MKLIMAAATDVGTVRENNEDFFYYSKPNQLIIVCDGMGGHQSGAVASRIAGKTVRDVFFHADFAELARLGEDIIDRLPPLALRLVIGARLANRRLLLTSQRDRNLRGMGTTLVAMAFGENSACAVHIGDSRLFCWRDRKLSALTEDHSLVNQLLQDRDIRQDQVKQFRKKNVLTRALGTHPTVKVDVQWFPVQAADAFLLCSDGFHNALHDAEITKSLGRPEPDLQKMIDAIVQKAKMADGSDNITAVIAKIEKVAASADKKDKVQMTLAEETARAIEFEDKFIKDKYPIEKSSARARGIKSKRQWWQFFAVAGGLLITALAYAFITRSWIFASPNETNQENMLMAAAELGAASTSLKPQEAQGQITASPSVGGYLVLLHIREHRQIEQVRRLLDARVLDQLNADQPPDSTATKSGYRRRSLSTGQYSMVLADSLHRIVYRKDGIRLSTLPANADSSTAPPLSTVVPATSTLPNEITASLPRSAPNDNTGNAASAVQDTSRVQQQD